VWTSTDILRLLLGVLGPLGMALMIGGMLVIAVEAARWLWGDFSSLERVFPSSPEVLEPIRCQSV
jgi:hypothetical protein